MGVIPCTFGEDVRPNMDDEEATYINNSYQLALSNRYHKHMNDITKLNECFEALIQK